MRKALYAANWKENKTNEEAAEFVRALAALSYSEREIVICPSFVSIISAYDCARGSGIRIGAQDVSNFEAGAYTGEVSASMLAGICEYVIVGHSERRQHFYDNDKIVNDKVHLALKHGLKPIVCLGENLPQHKNHRTFAVVSSQLKHCLQNVPADKMPCIVIAYEPRWAISGGDKNHKPATPYDAELTHGFIRHRIAKLYGEGIAADIRIIYGGSVKPENIACFMEKDDVDGALVGTASLDIESFKAIIST
jgi:triosephosphate isomerase